jgi:hypothetical protein
MESKSRGQSLVEFALILPILLLLTLGVIEGARLAWAFITVQEAAREATRYAVSGQPFNQTGDPWSFGPDISDGYTGLCLQGVDDFGSCNIIDPTDSAAIDRVEAITNMTIKRAHGLPVQRYAFTTDVFTATGYYDAPATLGVLVMGYTDAYSATATTDNAGKEGLNVLVHVYYNVEMVDPLYSTIVRAVTGGNNFIRVQGMAQMQNEGVDAALGSVPPAAVAPPEPPQGGGAGGTGGMQPTIISPDGDVFEAGSSMRVRLEQHTAGNHYDIYLGTRVICGSIEANNFGIAEPTCSIPPDFPPGEDYELFSTLHGGTSHVADGVYIDITRIGEPTLLVADAYRWPAGSRITLQLRSHDPHIWYDVYFHGGMLGTVQVDEFGDADLDWIIPSDTPSREPPDPDYDLETLVQGTTSPVIASSGIYVTEPQILVQGGNTWPGGTMLMANLRRHAPNHSYEVRCNGQSVGSFATDANGLSVATIFCTIPYGFPDTVPPNGYYTVTSYDNGILIGQTDVIVSTPSEPYLVVVGGYDWPAGSPIEIQVFDHEADRDHELLFESWPVVDPWITTDASGYAQTAYIIPITATGATTYTLRSYDLVTTQYVATRTLTVRGMPEINVSEGEIVQPGTSIHINLTRHAGNTVYHIYLGGVPIGSVQTDNDGEATFIYHLDDFGTTGGPFVLQSQLSGVQAAYTYLTIVAADLEVVSIQVPETPVFNAEMPITVTIRNTSTVTVSGLWFDTDIYLDPEHTPDPIYPYPPGEFKLWIDYLAPGGTATFVQDVVLYGAGDHTIYARTNTSQYILETDAGNPHNNMKQITVAPDSCASLIDEALTTDADTDNVFGPGWADVAFGNADDTPSTASYSLANDVISLTSQGSSTLTDDDASGGYYLVYQQVSGDFDVSVRALSQSSFSGISQWAKFGLEVRDSTNSSARKVYLFKTRLNGIQYGYRTSDGGSVSRDRVSGTTDDLPVWLRMVRNDDQFSLYYAYTSNTPPEDGEWIYWNTYSVQMSGSVLVGLANASYSSSKANTVTFDNFYLCLDPTNLTACGEVQEENGLLVVDATNHVQHVERGGHLWQEVTIDGRRVMQALPNTGTSHNTEYTTNSPELQYQVNIQTPGDYYVWVYGAGSSSSDDSVHVGLNHVANSESDLIQLNNTGTTSWATATMDGPRAMIRNVGAGVNTINIWMDEDGAWFHKILLTTSSAYVPTGDVEQSPCVAGAPQQGYPPGMMVCTPPSAPLLQNGDFEDNPGFQTAWEIPNQDGTNISSANPHDSNLGLRMTSWQQGSGFKQPYTWQEFTMPDWITHTTTINLRLWRSVNQWATPEVTDTLHVVLRTTGMPATLVSTPTVIARGDDDFNYSHGEWDIAPAMLAAGQNPANYASQPLQLHFYDDSNSPTCLTFGPTCFQTDFYLDDIGLEICTSQAIPDPDPTKATIKGELRVWIGGIPTAKQGVRVWTYKQNGAMLTTYSLHDSSYGFYLLDPGEYVIYAEWWEGPDLYNALTTIVTGAGVEYIKNLDLY